MLDRKGDCKNSWVVVQCWNNRPWVCGRALLYVCFNVNYIAIMVIKYFIYQRTLPEVQDTFWSTKSQAQMSYTPPRLRIHHDSEYSLKRMFVVHHWLIVRIARSVIGNVRETYDFFSTFLLQNDSCVDFSNREYFNHASFANCIQCERKNYMWELEERSQLAPYVFVNHFQCSKSLVFVCFENYNYSSLHKYDLCSA